MIRKSRIPIDLAFFQDLADRFHAPGDFTQAYVIAHEVGHHVQTPLGISRKVRDLQQRAGRGEANAIQVRMELLADCFAGVWRTMPPGRGKSWNEAISRKA